MIRFILIVLLAGVANAQVSTSLSSAIVQHVSGATLRVARLELNRHLGRVDITLMAWNGTAFITTNPVSIIYDSTTTPTGASLIVALNKVNLSTPGNSLEARILNQLIASGRITGTLVGAPE